MVDGRTQFHDQHLSNILANTDTDILFHYRSLLKTVIVYVNPLEIGHVRQIANEQNYRYDQHHIFYR